MYWFMKKLIFMLLILGLFISGCAPQYENECTEFRDKLDNYIEGEIISVSSSECDEWIENKEPMMVGGTLIDITEYPGYDSESMKGYELIFRGINKEGKLYLTTFESNSLNHQIGEFYRFDVRKYCKSIYSAVLSGSYSDSNLEELKFMSC